MVIVLKRNIKPEENQRIRSFLEEKGCRIKEIKGEEETILGAVGFISFDSREVELLPGVDRVIPISKPYKLASREFKREDSIVAVGSIKIGGPRVVVVAGPCAVESREQILETAARVRESGAVILRGGAFKPRTSPYSFQGLAEEGLRYLKEAGEAMGMPVVSEIVSPVQADLMKQYVDILQIGARNMQNFELLKTVGSLGMPVVLKRGQAATVEELLMSAEYLLAHGADNVILCERGIRTFETYTRYTLDLSAIPVVKKLSHLPILVDPSHGTGIRRKVAPMALAAVAAGADGIIVEVHPRPDEALSDGPQSLYPEQFEKLMRDVEAMSPVIEKEVARLPKAEPKETGETGRLAADVSGRKATVSFQGERGAFSEMALRRYFDEEAEPVPCESFRDVFDSVLAGTVRYGIIPLENALSGSIHENYDLLLQFPDLKIIGEKTIRIIHNLIGLPGARLADISQVYSHPQGIAQCAQFLAAEPGWQKIPFYDTAGSVAHIARMGKKENAAIASAEAARVYGMEVLKEGIETNARNYTRFVIIAREEEANVDGPNKASVVFSTLDKPGSLFLALRVLAERGLNMKKLESRPILGKPWEYMFYVDVEVPQDTALFYSAVEELRGQSDGLRILGTYRS
jgi:3-deoxy-7-phosphoheptulonate synthase